MMYPGGNEFDPPDREQVKLLAGLSAAQRVRTMLEARELAVGLMRGRLTLVVKDVPALVCPNCGEAYTDEQAATQLLATAEQMAAAGTLVDVRQYVAA